MRIDLEATRKVVAKALDLGITLFDTADIYGNMGGSETMLGQALGDRRKDIVLATKFAGPMVAGKTRRDASRRYIMTAIEGSLMRLKTDWIDLYQLHMPDPLTPMEETLRALDDLIHQGKVRYIGCSNLPAWQMVEAQWIAREGGLNPFISAQDEYSLLVRQIEAEKLPAAQAYGMGVLPYFPLASGLLTGKCPNAAWMRPAGHAFRTRSKVWVGGTRPVPVGRWWNNSKPSAPKAGKHTAFWNSPSDGCWRGPRLQRKRDRRRHQTGATRRQRQGDQVDSYARRLGRDRSHAARGCKADVIAPYWVYCIPHPGGFRAEARTRRTWRLSASSKPARNLS